jgi:hypothetical protein
MSDNKLFDEKLFRECLPAEMLSEKRFVRYFLKPKPEGGTAKIPLGNHSDPNTWSTFDECVAARENGQGIGYCFYEGEIHALDLDHVRNPKTGALCYTAKEQLQRLNSWAEYSVSGCGLHIFFKGEVRGKQLIETCVQYWNPKNSPRFFALTCKMVGDYGTLRNVGADFNYIFAQARHISAKCREELQAVDPEQWAKLPEERPDLQEAEQAHEKSKHKTRKVHKTFAIKDFLSFYKLPIIGECDNELGHCIRLGSCPIKGKPHAGHNDTTCNFIFPCKDGGLAYKCYSTGCCVDDSPTTGIAEALKALAEGPQGPYPKPIYVDSKPVPRKLFLSTNTLDGVTEPNVIWTVEDVLMGGVLNLFVGDPDIGKSFMACHYIAQVTRDDEKVIIICREDHKSVWKKRVRAANGNLKLVTFVNHVGDENDSTYKEEWMLDNATHVEFLRQCIVSVGASLVVLDPLADLAANTDLNASGPVRLLFQPLNRIAEETGVCLLVNTHTTKAIVDTVIKSAAHSYQVMASAAVAWFFMEDRDAPGRTLFMCARNKFGGKKAGWRYTINDASDTDHTGVIKFQGKEYRSVNGMLREITDRTQDGTKAAQCRKFLLNLLKGGPKPTVDCNTAAGVMGFDKDTLNRACQSLRIKRDGKTWRIEAKEQEEQESIGFDQPNTSEVTA